jgi:hypothetical protein
VFSLIPRIYRAPVKNSSFLERFSKKTNAKLTFASLVLGTIIKGDFDRLTLLAVGGGFAVLFITLGIITLTNVGGKK